MWHIDAEIIALVFMLTIIFDVFKTNGLGTLKDYLFNTLSIVTVISILVDIVSSLAMTQYEVASWWLTEISLVFYFILTPGLSALWLMYTFVVINKTTKLMIKPLILMVIPYIIYSIIVLINPITGWIFTLSETNLYGRGVLFNIMYIMFYGYSFTAMILACICAKKIERTTGIVLIVFPVIAGLGIFLQQMLPGYLITGSAFTLVLLITYMFLQNRKITRDHLTGVYNRLAFSMVVDKISKNEGKGYILALAIDDFKLFNQTFGQSTGDELLKGIAEYLVEISPGKTCYRYGGDIFTLILRQSSEKQAEELALAIKEKFASSVYMENIGYTISVSMGVVGYPHSSLEKNASLITAIDFAIYQAKKHGKGQIAFYNEDLIGQVRRKYDVMDAITKALKNKSFEVYIQPIYYMKNKRFQYGEALLRLKSEEIGNISPDEFIEIAEETGQIVEITYFVLEKVCDYIKKNRCLFHDEISISVNFSVIQFVQADMVEKVKAIIKKYDVSPSLIKIEITESVIADSFDKLKIAMEQLKEFGIRFALDDYGKGYSNIIYLINLPFTFVKLDKEIIDNIESSTKFIDALIPMFKSLGKTLVAEGVENKEQFEILEKLSCDTIQGFYLAKPMPMENAAEFFVNNKSPCD